MQYQDNIEQLRKIRRIEVPGYLFTRLSARIESVRARRAPRRMIFAAIATLCLLIAANSWVVYRYSKQRGAQRESLQSLSEQLGLSTSNQIYYE